MTILNVPGSGGGGKGIEKKIAAAQSAGAGSSGSNFAKAARAVSQYDDPVEAAYQVALGKAANQLNSENGREQFNEEHKGKGLGFLGDVTTMSDDDVLRVMIDENLADMGVTKEQLGMTDDGHTIGEMYRHEDDNSLLNAMGKARSGIDSFNNWLGNGVDAAFEAAGGDPNAFNGQQAGGVISGLEDVGLAFIPGAGIPLSVGKAAIDSSDDIARAVTGRDSISQQELDAGQRIGSGAMAAASMGLSALGAGTASKGGRQAIKNVEKSYGKNLDQATKEAQAARQNGNLTDELGAELADTSYGGIAKDGSRFIGKTEDQANEAFERALSNLDDDVIARAMRAEAPTADMRAAALGNAVLGNVANRASQVLPGRIGRALGRVAGERGATQFDTLGELSNRLAAMNADTAATKAAKASGKAAKEAEEATAKNVAEEAVEAGSDDAAKAAEEAAEDTAKNARKGGEAANSLTDEQAELVGSSTNASDIRDTLSQGVQATEEAPGAIGKALGRLGGVGDLNADNALKWARFAEGIGTNGRRPLLRGFGTPKGFTPWVTRGIMAGSAPFMAGAEAMANGEDLSNLSPAEMGTLAAMGLLGGFAGSNAGYRRFLRTADTSAGRYAPSIMGMGQVGYNIGRSGSDYDLDPELIQWLNENMYSDDEGNPVGSETTNADDSILNALIQMGYVAPRGSADNG